MVLLPFTKKIGKVLAHKKKQTIRKPRKRPFQLNDWLDVWVRIKAGTARLTSLQRKKFSELTEEDAILDGFETLDQLKLCLAEMHDIEEEEEFDIVTFEPHWKPLYLIDRPVLFQLITLASERKLLLENKDLDRIHDKNQQLLDILYGIKALEISGNEYPQLERYLSSRKKEAKVSVD